MLVCYRVNKFDLTIWQTEDSDKMHPDYIINKELRYLETDIGQERSDTLLKNFLEFDPEIIDHHNPECLFRLELGGEG